MGIVVIGAVFVDIKGYPLSTYIPGGRNAGRIEQVHGGVSRNVVEDIANVELRPTFVGLVDDTGMGQDVIDKLARHKVNTRFIQKKPDGMGTWLAIFDNDGDVHAAISKRPDTTPLTGLLQEQGDEIFADCDSIALELDLEKRNGEADPALCQKVRQKGVCRGLQHEHCHGAAGFFAADRLFRLQPAGGRAAVLGRLRPPLPGRDVPGAHGQRAQRQHSQHGGDHGRAGRGIRLCGRQLRHRTRQKRWTLWTPPARGTPSLRARSSA